MNSDDHRDPHQHFQETDIEGTLEELSSNQEKGLTDEKVKEKRREFGPNTIEEEESHPVKDFLKNFWGPIPWMLEVACILAAVAQRWEDFFVILAMLLINGGVSYWHESRAEDAIKALKQKLSPTARVIRNGEQKTVPSKKLVPGDIIVVKMGDVVPADVKFLADQDVSIDESALTGESLPVDKKGEDLGYSGTSVKRGEAKAVVIATGRQTKFAKTVELVEEAGQKSHFQKAVMRIGKFLIGITFVLVAVIILVGIIRDDSVVDVLMFALVVTIAGIPQALPAVLSVTMTIGARRLARHKAIVSELSSMEEMAGLEVLCADKTGTLTKNELTLQEPVLLEAEDKNELLLTAALTCKRENNEDPIDQAILEGIQDKDDLDAYKIREFRPFDPTRKRAEAEVTSNGNSFTAAKGAPQVILDLVDADEQLRNDISEKIEKLGNEGFRALGVAKKQDDTWHYLGILSLLDPPIEGTDEVIREAGERGIDIRMVTGDHAAIAKQVAGQLGMGTDVKQADELFGEKEEAEADEENEPDHSIDEALMRANAFAQVTPEHKFKIIKQFQSQKKIVGMTGDGVNDAPALKQADVGIAVANATDAARTAAHLVLTAPGLSVIIHAVEEARRIFERMTSYSIFRITESLRVLMFMTLSILAFNFYPVTAVMIVLLAILNDIPIMLIAYDDVKTARQPVRWNMPRVLTMAGVLSIGGVISSFLLFWFIRTRLGLPEDTVRTMIFLKLLVAGHMTIFLTRNQGWMWDKPLPNIWFFLALEGTQVIGTLFAVYGWIIPPIGWTKALSVWGYAIVWLLILNVLQVFTYRIMERTGYGIQQAKKEMRQQSQGDN